VRRNEGVVRCEVQCGEGSPIIGQGCLYTHTLHGAKSIVYHPLKLELWAFVLGSMLFKITKST